MTTTTIAYQITAPAPRAFCAGVVVNEVHRVIEAAPILKYMMGWPIGKVLGYCREKGWKIMRVEGCGDNT